MYNEPLPVHQMSHTFAFITVVDVPDMDPRFLSTPYATTVTEHSSVVSRVLPKSALSFEFIVQPTSEHQTTFTSCFLPTAKFFYNWFIVVASCCIVVHIHLPKSINNCKSKGMDQYGTKWSIFPTLC